ncbi:hypothetical protein [Burkholderia ubonensis]|uniref:hypothetical protein n=1 Tax=Burkholderia ubonensis TaxID=101571 RepID=UPI002AAF55CD|nr:hypothetical protein [Burkholderia ubonensis]
MKNEQAAPTYLFATIGALTERGGRVTKATGSLAIAGLVDARVDDGIRLGKAGVVGNQVHYADGSTAQIVSGHGRADNGDFEPLAFVGSELDNGDTVTDSPEREGLVSACTFTVVKRSTVVRQGEGS